MSRKDISILHGTNINSLYKYILIMMGIVVTISMITVQTANAQVPDACGESVENACVVRSEEDAEELLEEFPDAIVEVDAEKYDNLDTEEIDIDDMNARDVDDEEDDEEDNENEEDSGDSGSLLQQAPQQQNNFQPIPPGQQNLPPAQQSGAGLNDACLKSGFSQDKCNNLLFSDDPGGYCSTLRLAGLDCPKIQDPAFTYGNPEAARQQSEQQIENTERAIQGFEETVPNNLGEGFADD
jgi:hypothetical protein